MSCRFLPRYERRVYQQTLLPPKDLKRVGGWNMSSASSDEDDALSLAESLNPRPSSPDPPPPPPPADPVRLSHVLGASRATHSPGMGRERLLFCGAGAAWTLGPSDRDPPRFIPAGIAGRHEPGGAPVEAAACSPGGLVVLAHKAEGAHRARLTVWSAPALGLQTPVCIASLACDRELGAGASAVGFAGGKGVPFVWVAARPGRGATVLAFDWRRAYDEALAANGGVSDAITGGEACVSWTPGGPGRMLHSVVSDGGACDVVACGASFLTFLSLRRDDDKDASTGAPNEPGAAGSWPHDARSGGGGGVGGGGRGPGSGPGAVPAAVRGIPVSWEPSTAWDSTTSVPPSMRSVLAAPRASSAASASAAATKMTHSSL